MDAAQNEETLNLRSKTEQKLHLRAKLQHIRLLHEDDQSDAELQEPSELKMISPVLHGQTRMESEDFDDEDMEDMLAAKRVDSAMPGSAFDPFPNHPCSDEQESQSNHQLERFEHGVAEGSKNELGKSNISVSFFSSTKKHSEYASSPVTPALISESSGASYSSSRSKRSSLSSVKFSVSRRFFTKETGADRVDQQEGTRKQWRRFTQRVISIVKMSGKVKSQSWWTLLRMVFGSEEDP